MLRPQNHKQTKKKYKNPHIKEPRDQHKQMVYHTVYIYISYIKLKRGSEMKPASQPAELVEIANY